MKSFTNTNPRDLAHALTLVRQTRQGGRTAAFAGGGSDLLGMMKERLSKISFSLTSTAASHPCLLHAL